MLMPWRANESFIVSNCDTGHRVHLMLPSDNRSVNTSDPPEPSLIHPMAREIAPIPHVD